MARLRIADAVGRVLGDRYRLTRPLGTGASAYVYVADDVVLRRRVAIKVLHPGLADDEAFLRRFRHEARVVAALRHPNILRVYDWGEDDGSPYLVTELLEGGSLRSLLDRGHLLTASQATAVGFGAAEALDHAHRRGLVHRDIKPANLLFDDEGRVCVADFGLARALAEATVTEPAGAMVGTARYAAPEQVRGRSLDARADVYALALVLVEAMTGTVPFATDTQLATLMARLDGPIVAPAGTGALGPVIEAAGTVDPGDRLDATSLVRSLQTLAHHLPPPARLPLVGPLASGVLDAAGPPTALGRPSAGRGAPGPEPASVIVDRAAAGPTGAAASGAAASGAGGAAGAWAREQPAPPPVGGPGDPDATEIHERADQPAPGSPHPEDDRHDGRDRDDGRDQGDTAAYDAAAYDTAAYAGAAYGDDIGAVDGEDAAYRDGTAAYDAAAYAGAAYADDAGAVYGEDAVYADGGEPYATPAAATGVEGRSWRRVVVAVVVLVVLAAGGSVGWALTHRPAPLVTVPALRGDTESQAAAVLARRHLVLGVAGRAYDPTARRGTVTGQTPAGGRIREDRTVAVTISLGPQPVKVPAGLAGQTRAEATKLLQAAGLAVGSVKQSTSVTVPSGDVISSSPSGGTLLPGAKVDLVVSTGKPTVTVPLLTGAAVQSYTAAAAALTAAHLVPSEQLVYSDSVAKGLVIITSPAPKATVLYGSPIEVEVSQGPHLATVPDVTDMSVAAADQALSAAGFQVSGVTGNPNGKVRSTSPAAGRTVLYGSAVQIVTRGRGLAGLLP